VISLLKEGHCLSEAVDNIDGFRKKLSSVIKDYFTLDEKVYMGYRITGFSVEQLEGKNVQKVTLSLKNLKNGFIYTSDRTTRCYCFSSDDFKKIISTDMDLNSL